MAATRQSLRWRYTNLRSLIVGTAFGAFWTAQVAAARLGWCNAMADESWTRERFEQMIAQKIEESYQLDYKSAGALGDSEKKKDDVTKDVSSFANSNGGMIIYGIKEFEDKPRKHLPEKIDAVDGRMFTREWLDQIIGQINPRIEGVRIVPVRVGTEEWQTCYVVEIPKGETAHQARSLKYYRRYNFEAVPMADHEIRDIMNRRRHPKLEFEVRLHQTQRDSIRVIFHIRNVGKLLPRQYGVAVLLPTVIAQRKLHRDDLMQYSKDGKHYWRFDVTGKNPVFPGGDVYCDYELQSTMKVVPTPTGDNITCTLFADEMPPVQRNVAVASALADWC